MARLVEAQACVGEEPKPLEAQWVLGGEEGRGPAVEGPVVVVEDLGEGHNLEEEVPGAAVPVVADQTDQGR